MDMNKISEMRAEFEPAVSTWTYLNAAACGLTPQFARTSMEQWWDDKLTNGSVHYHEWEEDALSTKQKFATLIHASQDEIAYTMNTSEGLNFAINGIQFKKGDNVVVNKYDFPSNFLPWLALKQKGVEVRCMEITDRRIPLENIESLIDERTKAVSISSVQFKTGFRCDLQGIGTLCKEHGIYFVVDAIQSLGALEMDVKKYNIDILCTSCYKWLLGPDGIGFLYCDEEVVDEIATTNIGWMSTPDPWSFPTELELMKSAQKFESGTLPWALIYAVDPILDMFNSIGVHIITDHIFRLLDHLIAELESRDMNILSPLKKDERSGIFIFDIDQRDALAEYYQAHNIRISVRDGIRVSPHLYNNLEDVDILLSHLDQFMEGL
jgi:selenocysteine lyase/cysteine desulfurase